MTGAPVSRFPYIVNTSYMDINKVIGPSNKYIIFNWVKHTRSIHFLKNT